MANVKFKLRMVKFLEPFSSLASNPTGIRKNLITVYEDLTSIPEIIAKIKEFFSEETCNTFVKSGDTLTYDEEAGITIDEEELKERLDGYFENMVKYGRAVWTQDFDAQGYMDVNWSDNIIKYEAQLIITEPKEEAPVTIYPQDYPNA